MQQIKSLKFLIISVFIGTISLNAFSQSKLQGAGKASKVGATTTTQKKPTTNTKPSTTKKSETTTPQTKRSSGGSDKYASKGYMEITGLTFANEDADDNIIDNYESKLYAKEVKYLTPKLSYKGLASVEKEITLDIKLFDEDGKLKTGTGSPEGFTYSKKVKIETGTGKNLKLPGWGNPKGGSYNAGLYKMEIWYKDNMLYQKEIRLYSGATPIVSCNIFTISSISFANTDKDGKIISDYGQPLLDGKVQYLKPKIYYNGKYSNNQEVTLYVRYFKSSGELVSGSSSPVGFSFKENVTIKPGSNSVILSGFGNEAATNYKEGNCKVEIWLDGEKLYETSATISKPGASTYISGGNEMNLKAMLEKPMMIGNSNPFMSSYFSVKNSLSSTYTLDDNSDDTRYSFYVWPSSNSSVRNLTYCGVPFDHFYFMVEKDSGSSLQRRMSYDFEIQKNKMESPTNPYPYLDQMIRDFSNAGINLSYERINDTYLKAKGQCQIGNIRYDISLDEYNTNWKFSIDIWVWK